MTHVIKTFWLFFFATVLSGGLLGRYIAAFIQGYGSWGMALMSLLLTTMFAFSVTLLIRILRADAQARRSLKERDRA